MSLRFICMLVVMLIFASACRLKAIEEAAVITQAPSATVAASSTAQSSSTAQPTFTTAPTQAAEPTALSPNCVPTHPEWPSYSVRSGDTLSSIANRTGTTADTLASVNCIANANLISAGMNLRVPRLPVTSTPSNTSIPVIDIGIDADSCRVIARGVQASVWGPGDGQSLPVAYLKAAALVSVADNAFVVDIPNQSYDGWVSMSEATLFGTNCPSVQPNLLTVGGQGTVPIEGCWLVNSGSTTINIYFQPQDTSPIAIMGSFLPYAGAAGNGFRVHIPEFGHEGYIAPTANLSLQGNNCNQPQPAQQCLVSNSGLGMIMISPATARSATCVGLQAGVVTVTWPEAPQNATMIEFWRVNANGLTDIIGIDSNMADGASIQWEVHGEMPPSLIYAIPYVQGGAADSGQLAVFIGQ